MLNRVYNGISVCSLAVVVLSSTNAHASLLDRGNGFIYDTNQDITWYADANYARTTGESETGAMTWHDANSWASQLNIDGYTGWRLPGTQDADSSCSNQWDFFGSGNVVGAGYGCTGSEMGNLYYNGLNNVAAWDYVGAEWVDQDGVWQVNEGSGTTNTGGLFYNLMPGLPVDEFGNRQDGEIGYWSESMEADETGEYKWHFHFGGEDGWDGYQGWWTSVDAEHYTFIVSDGDIAAPTVVPVPAAIWLFISGVIGLVGVSRRKKI